MRNYGRHYQKGVFCANTATSKGTVFGILKLIFFVAFSSIFLWFSAYFSHFFQFPNFFSKILVKSLKKCKILQKKNQFSSFFTPKPSTSSLPHSFPNSPNQKAVHTPLSSFSRATTTRKQVWRNIVVRFDEIAWKKWAAASFSYQKCQFC